MSYFSRTELLWINHQYALWIYGWLSLAVVSYAVVNTTDSKKQELVSDLFDLVLVLSTWIIRALLLIGLLYQMFEPIVNLFELHLGWAHLLTAMSFFIIYVGLILKALSSMPKEPKFD